MSKPLHTGKSSYAGVLSAYLAREGFTGATKILEGEKGFCRAMVAEPHLEKLTEGLGLGFKIDDNSFKPYPCCKHSHASLYALQVLQKENKFTAADVAKVEVLVNSITDSLINNPNPQTVYGCKFSLQYCDASMLIYGNVGIEQFSAQAMANPETRALMQKIEVRRDPEIQQVYDTDPSKLATKVIVTLKDGRKLEKEVDYPKGDPACPMTWEDSVAKFTALAEPVYGKEKTAKLCALIDKLDEVKDFRTALRSCL
jgi:2-methylcitrate dehydratase PrpD